jgi:hypothetical protein
MPGIAEESTCHNPRTRRLYSRPLLSPPNFLIHSQRKVRVRAIFSCRVFFVFLFLPFPPRSPRVSALALRAAVSFCSSFGQLRVSGRGAGERDVTVLHEHISTWHVTVLHEHIVPCASAFGFDAGGPLSLSLPPPPPPLPLLTLRTHPVLPERGLPLCRNVYSIVCILFYVL